MASLPLENLSKRAEELSAAAPIVSMSAIDFIAISLSSDGTGDSK
jgi:hypothetical protein